MAKINSIDGYIDRALPFAQEILQELRQVVHTYCPEVEEGLKWSMPHFMYKGSILCSMAAFKQHCAFGFWLQSQMKDVHGIFKREAEGGMGHLGKIQSVADLPQADKLGAYILQAKDLIDAGVKLKKAPVSSEKSKELKIPKELTEALKNDSVSEAVFESFSFTNKREYVDWLNDAKTDATFQRRLETTLSNLREGKIKEWKYQKSKGAN